MDLNKNGILDGIHSLLKYHQTIGIESYPAGDDVTSFLTTAAVVVEPDSVVQEVPDEETMDVVVGEEAVESCGDIAGEVRSCTGCILHRRRLFAVPGRGGERVRLLLVGGWFEGQNEAVSEQRIFGIDEDRMVMKMLAAIHLQPEEAFITNVVKCAVPEACQPGPDQIHTCLSFLHRQIEMLSPQAICTMGLVATKALLKKNLPLSQLRGKFYPYEVSEKKTIPVMPTYHPSFLLEHPEFKRATWGDLQAIARLLAAPR